MTSAVDARPQSPAATGGAPSSAPPLTARVALIFAAIIAITAVLTLYRLGAADVCGANEAVEAVFLQQMVEHGAWLFPLENGHAPMYKPPLFHWTGLLLDRATGVTRVTPFNLRLPAALYAIAGLLLTLALAHRLLGDRAAVLAGLILAASYQYIEQARIGRVDMTLCFCETLALFSFIWWDLTADATTAGRRRRVACRYLFALALGLGVLAKGPVGALLPALACGIFLLVERRLGDLQHLATPGPVALAIVVGASWYVAGFFGHRYGLLDRQLGSENFGRFFGTLGAMAPWYYVKPLLLNSVPFSLLAPIAVYAALRTRRADGQADEQAEANRAAPRAMRLCAIFWLVTVVFFTFAAYKRRAYLLPLWPATALMIAWWIATVGARRGGRILQWGTVAACAIMIGFNFFYLPQKEIRDCGDRSFRTAAATINRIVGRSEPLYLYRFGDEPAPLLFYLDRNAPAISGRLGDAPPGYVITPTRVWQANQAEALDLTPVFTSTAGRPPIVLLRRGPAYALIR